MGQLVRWEWAADGIARVDLDNPPINALSHVMRAELIAALGEIGQADGLRAVMIGAVGNSFPAGVATKELDGPQLSPNLADTCRAVENMPVPVVAVMHGTALGAGCELALACHYRVASPRSFLGLPEIRLGLMPMAGSTQRLARMVGAAVALELMLVGRPIAAPEAERLGLVDRVLRGPLRREALTYVEDLLLTGQGARPASVRAEGLSDYKSYLHAISDFRTRMGGGPVLAPRRIIECVEAAQLLPFEAGLDFEAAAFEECLNSESSRGLRHAVLAERRAAALPKEASITPVDLKRVAVVGKSGGVMSAVAAMLAAGVSVTAFDQGEAVLAQIEATTQTDVDAKRLTPEKRQDMLSHFNLADESQTVAQFDAVLTGSMDEMQRLDPDMRVDAVAVVAVRAGVDVHLKDMPRGARAVVLQIPKVWPQARLAEVMIGPRSQPAVVLSVIRMMRAGGYVPLLGSADDGGIGASIWGACIVAVDGMIGQGVTPDEIEAALADKGFAHSPLAGRTPRTPGPRKRTFPADEIYQRCLAAMVNTGLLLMQERIVRRASDIDVALIHGYGFPAWRGGPMKAADMMGLLHMKRTLQALSVEDSDFWTPAPLLSDLIMNGQKIADYVVR